MQLYEKTFPWQCALEQIGTFLLHWTEIRCLALYAKPYSTIWKVQCTCMASDTVQGAPGVSHPSVYLLTSLLITYKWPESNQAGANQLIKLIRVNQVKRDQHQCPRRSCFPFTKNCTPLAVWCVSPRVKQCSVLTAKMYESHLFAWISWSVHEQIFMLAFRWLARKKWYEFFL